MSEEVHRKLKSIILQSIELFTLCVSYNIIYIAETALDLFILTFPVFLYCTSQLLLRLSYNISTIILFLIKLPFVAIYFIYVSIPLYVIHKLLHIIEVALRVSRQRSDTIRVLSRHLSAVYYLSDEIKTKLQSTSICELISFLAQTVLELLFPTSSGSDPEKTEHSQSFIELSEVLSYVEVDESSTAEMFSNTNRIKQRSRMHHDIPLNLFKATVRIHKKHKDDVTTSSANAGDSIVTTHYMEAADTPASFPPTPYSRAFVMNRSADRVDSVMFAARDKLRMESQSVSRDAFSRQAAYEAQTSGQYAVFDHRQTSSGIMLSCGNHCAMKVGLGLSYSCRSTMPVRSNTYVYVEFSITVLGAQIPSLGFGLTPPDCPLNVMAGSWPRSIGLYTDGQMIIGSRYYKNKSLSNIGAGATVGLLVYLPSSLDNSEEVEGSKYRGLQDSSCQIVHEDEYVGRKSDSSFRIPTPGAEVMIRAKQLNVEPDQSISIQRRNSSKSNLLSNLLSKLPLASVLSVNALNGLSSAEYHSHSAPSTERDVVSCPSMWKELIANEKNNADSATSINAIMRCNTSSADFLSLREDALSFKEANQSNSSSKSIHEKSTVDSKTSDLKSYFDLEPVSGRMDKSADLVMNFNSNNETDTSANTQNVVFKVNINGKQIECGKDANKFMNDLASFNAVQYPTVSLISSNTKVWCRFCEDDIVYKTRSEIGAPLGVKVYCLDGSQLLDEMD